MWEMLLRCDNPYVMIGPLWPQANEMTYKFVGRYVGELPSAS
jgi:hypothetical protein